MENEANPLNKSETGRAEIKYFLIPFENVINDSDLTFGRVIKYGVSK